MYEVGGVLTITAMIRAISLVVVVVVVILVNFSKIEWKLLNIASSVQRLR